MNYILTHKKLKNMKNITELSDKQILALTDEQLDKMVKLRMAEQGIKILDMPIEPTYLEMPPKTEELYSVSGFTYKLNNREDAEELALALKKVSKSTFNTSYVGNDYSSQYGKKLEQSSADYLGTIAKENYYKQEIVAEINEIKETNKKLKEDYEYDLNEYNNEQEAGKEVREEVYGTYQKVSKKYYDMDVFKARYEQYLSLADGNAKTAMKFLKNAYSIDSETEEYVVSGKVSDVVEAKVETLSIEG